MSQNRKHLRRQDVFFATNVSEGAQVGSITRPFSQNLISCNFQHSKTLEKHESKEKLFALNGTLFVLSWFCSDQVHFKHEQSQIRLIESRVTIGTIQQTQDAASVLWVYRHKSWHATWPTVILIFMETRWRTPALSPPIKLNFVNNDYDIHFWRSVI